MRRTACYFFLFFFTSFVHAQNTVATLYAPQKYASSAWDKERNFKPKPISYTALGYLAPLHMNDIIVGGTSSVYKRFGTFLSYKVGIKNWMMPDGTIGEFTYDNVKKNVNNPPPNQWVITPNTQKAVTFMISGGLAFSIWKKMPIYIGIGATRYREFFEYIVPFDTIPKWNVNTDKTGFQLNYTGGFMIPLFSRVILNVGYDHNPQSVFIGIGIRSKEAYDDIDEW